MIGAFVGVVLYCSITTDTPTALENPTQYSIGVRGHGYGSVYPDWFHNYSEDALYKLWAYDHVQFIDPDPNRNNVELKLIEK